MRISFTATYIGSTAPREFQIAGNEKPTIMQDLVFVAEGDGRPTEAYALSDEARHAVSGLTQFDRVQVDAVVTAGLVTPRNAPPAARLKVRVESITPVSSARGVAPEIEAA